MKNPEIFVVMLLYMCAIIGIGIYFYKRAQRNSENYFLGGRSLGPWVAAMSAEASDMSGWLLMGRRALLTGAVLQTHSGRQSVLQ